MICAMKSIGDKFTGKCIIISTLDTQIIATTVRHV